MIDILHKSQELSIWRTRWNDPAWATEKNDIKAYADLALSGNYNKYTNYYTGSNPWPTLNTDSTLANAVEPRAEDKSSQSILAAAFCYKLGSSTTGYNQTQIDTLKTSVIGEIERYAGIGQLNYASNPNLVGSGYIFPWFSSVNPGFFIAEWMLKLLDAYSYVGGVGESTIADEWFGKFAHYSYYNDRNQLGGNPAGTGHIPGRLSRDYSTFSSWAISTVGTLWDGSGITCCGLQYNYSNREIAYLRYLTLYAWMYENTTYKDYIKLTWKEYLAFGFTKDCDGMEYVRSGTSDPEAASRYIGITVFSLSWIADVFARGGDTSLYNYELDQSEYDIFYEPQNLSLTCIGNWKGLGKTLYKVIDQFMKLNDRSYDRYKGGELIDCYTTTWQGGTWTQDYINDQLIRQTNIWYKDSNWMSIYNRTKAGTRPLDKTRYLGSWRQTRGLFGGQVSHFFMYQDLETLIDPYDPEPVPTPSSRITIIKKRW